MHSALRSRLVGVNLLALRSNLRKPSHLYIHSNTVTPILLGPRKINVGHVHKQRIATLNTTGLECPLQTDTIFALSSASGKAAIAVIRISGPKCRDIYDTLCPGQPSPKPRHATLRKLFHPVRSSTLEVLDSASLILFFPGPRSITGEDVLELHIHGGPATVKALLQALPLCALEDEPRGSIRFAEPGEFTKRAFYNGRADLTQIEALGDTLAAETEQQRRLAVKGSTDSLAARYESWRQDLLHARGELEALIDFSEDQHFNESPTDFLQSVGGHIERLKHQIMLHIGNAAKGELLRNGISIALLGAPNAGKSSLLNRIVGREAAIVSAEEGTTRDIVDVSVDIGGWLCRFGDMAGLRGNAKSVTKAPSAIGAVEQEGIRRAKERALASELVCIMLSVERTGSTAAATLPVDQEVIEAAAQCADSGKTLLIVINKVDLIPADSFDADLAQMRSSAAAAFPFVDASCIFPVCCKDTASLLSSSDLGNIQSFLNGLIAAFSRMTSSDEKDQADYSSASHDPFKRECSSQGLPLSVTQRQAFHLQACYTHLTSFQSSTNMHVDGHDDLVSDSVDVVVAAEHLRSAAECLAKITGKGETGDVEDVLGVVFEK
ncbi:MAG: hypothetical protein Q9227_002980 [Pyrenula ochraceoflavens]